jgi:epoxide hydrolase 4
MSKDAYVEANGIRLHYLVKGAGPLIIFLHGFPEYSGAWKEQLAEFGQDHLAVAPDMRGYNNGYIREFLGSPLPAPQN